MKLSKLSKTSTQNYIAHKGQIHQTLRTNTCKLSEPLRCATHMLIKSIPLRNKPYHEIWTSVSKVGCEWFWFFTNISWYLDSACFSLKKSLCWMIPFFARIYISWIMFSIFSSTKVTVMIAYCIFQLFLAVTKK